MKTPEKRHPMTLRYKMIKFFKLFSYRKYYHVCLTIQLHISSIFQNLCKLIVADICDEVINRVQIGRVEELDDATSPFPEIETVINNITISFLITNIIVYSSPIYEKEK